MPAQLPMNAPTSSRGMVTHGPRYLAARPATVIESSRQRMGVPQSTRPRTAHQRDWQIRDRPRSAHRVRFAGPTASGWPPNGEFHDPRPTSRVEYGCDPVPPPEDVTTSSNSGARRVLIAESHRML